MDVNTIENELYNKALTYVDAEETVYSGYLFLLKKIAEKAAVFKTAKQYEEFAKMFPDFENELIETVLALEQFVNDGM